LLCDEKREIGMAYGACDSPDAKTARRITYVIGPDGKIQKAYPKVSPADHPEQILREIETAA
jgi:peroxiredoxin Q/BCP